MSLRKKTVFVAVGYVLVTTKLKFTSYFSVNTPCNKTIIPYPRHITLLQIHFFFPKGGSTQYSFLTGFARCYPVCTELFFRLDIYMVKLYTLCERSVLSANFTSMFQKNFVRFWSQICMCFRYVLGGRNRLFVQQHIL